MYVSELRKALLAAAEIFEASDRSNATMMFDALANLQLMSRSGVEDHLVSISLRPEWRAAAEGPVVYH